MQEEDKTKRPSQSLKGDRLIEVKITVIKGKQIWDFDNRPLNTGCLLIRSRIMQV